MDTSAVLTKLNLRIKDTDNFTFTAEEKTEAVEEAFRDPYVAEYAWIDSETYSTSTFRQALPSGITAVEDILYPVASGEPPDSLPGTLWEVRGGYIRWSRDAKYTLTNGSTIYLEGWNKLTTSDTITEPTVQEYAINLAIYNTLKGLSSQKTYRFTKNDVSVGELVAMRQQAEREVFKYQQKIADRGYVAG